MPQRPTSVRPPIRPHRVLVTRAAGQASVLAERLRKFGMEPVVVPGIEFVEPSSFAALDAAIAHVEHFDWLLFTSANAVRFLLKRVPDVAKRKLPRVAVVGPATANAVRDAGLPVDLIAPQAVAESLAEALLPYALHEDRSPARFLLVRAEDARELLPEVLRAAGAEVIVAPAYQTVVPAASVALVHTMFADRENWPDAVTFTSASTVRNLLALCEAAGVVLPSKVLRISIGPITSATLMECGYQAYAESAEASVASLAEAVLNALRQS